MHTESVNRDTVDLDLLTMSALVSRLVEQQVNAVVEAAATARQQVATAADAVLSRLNQHGRLVYVGCGTSGRLAEADAAELNPTFGFATARWAVLRPTDTGGRGEDSVENGRTRVRELNLSETDAVVAVSASGTTPFVLGAVREAKLFGALVVCVVNNADTPLASRSDYAIELLTGPEAIAGSTRMAAGLAQKLILTTLSTAIFCKLGATYGNRMTRATGEISKLNRRRTRLLQDLTGLDNESASRLLIESGGDVEVAVLCHRFSLPLSEARLVLEGATSLRSAIRLLDSD